MRHRVLQAALAALLLAVPVPEVAGATSGANVALVASGANLLQTGDRMWTLEKSGSLTGDTVSWEITATETATTPGQLIIEAAVALTNIGSEPATIGNIVVNLQKRVSNKWVTKSSDIANATQGDAATTAVIHKAASSENKTTWSENSASGSLNFMDATNNTVFSLVPQQMIGAGQTRTVLLSASFDNNDAALNLTAGTQIRAEVIVTFGNATQSGNSTANLDINGNGSLDADESRVRSVPSRLTLTVPAAVDGNAAVALTDTLDDISKTGDVTFSNVQFNLGATSGTVTASVSGGTNGGSITNCAHLRSADQTVNSGSYTFPIVNGIDLQACSTVEVGGAPPSCTPGAPGCGWETGEMHTATQVGWDSGSAATLLAANFSSLYGGALVLGGNFTMTFTNASAIFAYLPSAGSPATLTGDVENPLTTSSGELGGQVLALQLNSDFSALFGNDVPFGDLRICNVSAIPVVNDMTIDEFLTAANVILGGGTSSFGPSTAFTISNLLNSAFLAGAPSAFAQANLVAAPSCVN